MPAVINLLGQRFGYLYVVGYADSVAGRCHWHCVCDCGQELDINSQSLRYGKTKSCGCKRTNGATLEGIVTSEYQSWRAMRTRCYNNRSKDYHKYGGRGIVVCLQWKDSFSTFLADMGRKPSNIHSLERIDNNGNYEPSNCRWATPKEQANNRRYAYISAMDLERLHIKLREYEAKFGPLVL